jgi:hypothetical protein
MRVIAILLALLITSFSGLACDNRENVNSLCAEDSENIQRLHTSNNIEAVVYKAYSEESFYVWEKDLYKRLLPLSKNKCIVSLKYMANENAVAQNIRWAVVEGSQECPSVGAIIHGNMSLEIIELNPFIYDATFTIQDV